MADYLSTMNYAAAAAPVAPAVATLGLSGFLRRWNQKKGVPLSPDQVPVLTRLKARQHQASAHLGAAQLLVFGSTFGVRQGARYLNQLWNAGYEHTVSSILVIEPAITWRHWLIDNTPPTYHERFIWAHPTHRGSGYDAADHRTVLDDADIFGPTAIDGGLAAIDQHLRRNENRFVTMVVAFLGQGGSALLSSLALEPIKKRFNCQIVAVTALPEFEELRNRFPKMKRWYELFGVDVWFPIDNLNPDIASLDRAMVLLILGLLESADHSDAAQTITNLLRLVSGHRNGSVLLVQTLTEKLAAFPYTRPNGELGHYIQRAEMTHQTILTARRLNNGEGLWSVEVPIDPELPYVDVILLPLGHADLVQVSDALQRGRWVRTRTLDAWDNDHSPNGHIYRTANYAQVFSSLPVVITDPATAQFPITALRLIAARDDGNLAEEIAKIPQRRATQTSTFKTLSPAFESVKRGAPDESEVSA